MGKRMTEDKEIEVIGGAEKYMATCRSCYMASVKIPASPRGLSKCNARSEFKENNSRLSNIDENENLSESKSIDSCKRNFDSIRGFSEIDSKLITSRGDSYSVNVDAKKPLFD